MALWLVRAERHGEFEEKFLADGRIYLTWGELDQDLGAIESRDDIKRLLRSRLPDAAERKISHGTGQIWAFVQRMQPGDWVVLPSKLRPAIHIGEIVGGYTYAPSEDAPAQSREVRWIAQDIPRSNFDQDLLYSFGAFMTICRIKRNDAEARVRAMANKGWRPVAFVPEQSAGAEAGDSETEDSADSTLPVDLEEIGFDQIARQLIAKFKGHGLERLVRAILDAQGYTTYLSPKGPDKGVDILAGSGPMGFGQPRICVQVKSTSEPIPRETLDQLVGTMQSVQADQGLLVSWGGFKSSVEQARASQFFRVRLWDQKDLIEQILRHYNELDEEIRAELPLKRIWCVAYSAENDA